MPLCYSAILSRSLRRDGADLKGFGISQQAFCNAKIADVYTSALLAGTMSSMKQKQFHQRRLYGCADFQNIVILKYELGLKVAKLLAWFPFRNY